jgi:hypothetical protein
MSDRWDEEARDIATYFARGMDRPEFIDRVTNRIAAALRRAYAEALRDFRDRISDGSASYGGDHLREALAVEIARIAPAQPATPEADMATKLDGGSDE